MFKIMVQIAEFERLDGLVALDERRRLGLPDESVLCHGSKGGSRAVEVSEGYARLHFPPTETFLIAHVPLRFLGKGDVVQAKDYNGVYAAISPDITDDRIRELFAAAKPNGWTVE